MPAKEILQFDSLDRCCGVPIIRYSVLEGLRERRFERNQVRTVASVEESSERLEAEAEGGNEM